MRALCGCRLPPPIMKGIRASFRRGTAGIPSPDDLSLTATDNGAYISGVVEHSDINSGHVSVIVGFNTGARRVTGFASIRDEEAVEEGTGPAAAMEGSDQEENLLNYLSNMARDAMDTALSPSDQQQKQH